MQFCIIKFSGPGPYLTLAIVFGVLSGVLFILLAKLLISKRAEAKKTTATASISKIDEEEEGENEIESEAEWDSEEEEEEELGKTPDGGYINNTVFNKEYEHSYANHELYYQ